MQPKVSIIMGSISDYEIVEKAVEFLNEMEVPFEVQALSAHRTPHEVKEFATNAHKRGVKVIIAAAGMAAHLPGVVASLTHLPVIGLPIKSSFEGLDALLSIVQMPPGIPVATVGVNAAQNAAILALQILATSEEFYLQKILNFKNNLKDKVIEANKKLSEKKYKFKVE